MKVCYNNFFKLLNDREIRKMEIAKMADISQNTMARLSWNQNVSLDVLDDTVSPLQLDGVEPSEKTVKDGSYTLQRPFVMATNGKISEQSKQAQAVFDFINSDAGQKIIEKVGLVTPNK